MAKKQVTQEQYNKLWELWKKACVFDHLDPDLEGAVYIFSKENPWAGAYQEYKEELQS